jgi:16S rRNA (uracil1498-N3)-methyltransferase
MHRFYLPPERCAGAALRLDGREAHHALNVLRLQLGELVTVLDGAGNEFLCAVETSSRAVLTLSVSLKNFVAAPPCAVTLLVGLPKGKIIESVIQKAVELGVRRVVPILSERVVTQLDDAGAENKREKWRQVAIEAIKQCGAAWLPAVEAPVTIGQFLARQEKFELSFVGSLQKERHPPRAVLRDFEIKHGRPPQNAAVWIGPEGDFSTTELAAIQDSGAQPVTFGKLVLRVETAAIYCLSFLKYEFQRD